MKKLQVFELLDLPEDLQSELLDWSEANNNSYITWFLFHDYPGGKFQEELDNWLVNNGLEKENDEYPEYVLFNISW